MPAWLVALGAEKPVRPFVRTPIAYTNPPPPPVLFRGIGCLPPARARHPDE